jgi:microcystin-dependent protein
MSNCTNCFNGCTEIVSDRCVRYTGIDVPALGINNGDTLSAVEEAIVNFLVPTLDGTGIKPVIAPSVLCDLVKSFLPACTTCTGFTLNQILTAIIQSACSLQVQINTINSTLTTLNADYTIGCLTGVTASSDTHAIVQAVITKLCSVEDALEALALTLETTYSSNGAELDAYIANYLATHSTSASLVSNRMVPYTVVPYFGPLSNFSSTGVGLGDWINIYLCNGLNGTPDLRGRALVGVTAVPGGGAYPAQTDPALGNPTYTLNVPLGTNGVTLTVGQIPAHAHPGSTASTSISPNPHTHTISPSVPFVESQITASGTGSTGSSVPTSTPLTAGNTTLTAATTLSIEPQGGGQSHPNFQPGLGCYFIMYRPTP